MNKSLTLIAGLLISTSSFAMLCPTNFNQISVGDSIDSVQQQCGKASETKKHTESESLPQEWNYFLNANPRALNTAKMNSNAATTLKMTITFDKGKITNMNVNGVTVGRTALCGASIGVGDKPATVESACGKPVFVLQGQPADSSKGENSPPGAKPEAPTNVTELIYNTGASTDILVFENGLLKEKK